MSCSFLISLIPTARPTYKTVFGTCFISYMGVGEQEEMLSFAVGDVVMPKLFSADYSREGICLNKHIGNVS